MHRYNKINNINNDLGWPFMLNKFLDPKNDMAFKKIFGSEKNKYILIHFLNDMLEFKAKKPIIDVKFLKPVQDPEIAARKTSIVDILCTDEIGNCYIVEMQVAKEKGFTKRAQFYAAKAYGSQLNIGGAYNDLKEVIFLAIADFIMFPEKTSYKSDHIILDRNSYEHDLKDFSFSFLELAKFNKPKEQLSTMIEKWCYFFKYANDTNEQDLPQIIGHDSIIQQAYEELNKFNWNQEELNSYEAAIKKDMDYNAAMAQKFDEGLEKGKVEGKIENAKEIALAMLAKCLDINLISDITKLSVKEVQDL